MHVHLGGRFQQLRDRFRGWRQTRPFWAGLFTVLGGLEIMLLPMGPLPVVFRMGIGALGGILIGACLMLAGGFLWRAPDRQMRQFLALFIGLFAVASFVISNFGGFLVGMLLGILGAAMAYGWRPLPGPEVTDPDPPGEPLATSHGGAAAEYSLTAAVRPPERREAAQPEAVRPPERRGDGGRHGVPTPTRRSW